ncbi:MAG: DNA-directed RNA polymerase subunit alpha C-terminal domain-containing protein [Candidatus Moranbacteria bacterium]|nr:DNA-directed RNA polymerase subunit alpha C-terminal domain-containing protein [Candidatus Moranbacteria bacterium]
MIHESSFENCDRGVLNPMLLITLFQMLDGSAAQRIICKKFCEHGYTWTTLVGDVVCQTEEKLTIILGSESLNVFKDILDYYDLSLAMTFDKDKIIEDISTVLNISVHDLNLTTRAKKCLISENIFCIGQLVLRKESEILKIPGMGRKTFNEIERTLWERGLYFGMHVADAGTDYQCN